MKIQDSMVVCPLASMIAISNMSFLTPQLVILFTYNVTMLTINGTRINLASSRTPAPKHTEAAFLYKTCISTTNKGFSTTIKKFYLQCILS